jgi:hypothetical protein
MCHTASVLAVGALVLTGCHGGRGTQLPDDPDELTLFSIDGPTWEKQEGHLLPEQQKNGLLLGYPILGKVEITDRDQRRAVAAAVIEGTKYKGSVAACFYPRHAIRAVKAGQVIQVVICFECLRYQSYRGDQKAGSGGISGDAQPLLDKLLTDAGVPLAPKTRH